MFIKNLVCYSGRVMYTFSLYLKSDKCIEILTFSQAIFTSRYHKMSIARWFSNLLSHFSAIRHQYDVSFPQRLFVNSKDIPWGKDVCLKNYNPLSLLLHMDFLLMYILVVCNLIKMNPDSQCWYFHFMFFFLEKKTYSNVNLFVNFLYHLMLW